MTTNYEKDCANACADLFHTCFYDSPYETEDGLREAPASAYQFVISALELFCWETKDRGDRMTLKQAAAICERLRDEQKYREWCRRQHQYAVMSRTEQEVTTE